MYIYIYTYIYIYIYTHIQIDTYVSIYIHIYIYIYTYLFVCPLPILDRQRCTGTFYFTLRCARLFKTRVASVMIHPPAKVPESVDQTPSINTRHSFL